MEAPIPGAPQVVRKVIARRVIGELHHGYAAFLEFGRTFAVPRPWGVMLLRRSCVASRAHLVRRGAINWLPADLAGRAANRPRHFR